MERIMCEKCFELARYSCACIEPNLKFCKQHREEHEESFGDHYFKICQTDKVYPNQVVKTEMIEKIKKIMKEAKEQKHKIRERSSEAIDLIEKKSSFIVGKLREFLNLCSDVLIEVMQINVIEFKFAYNPVEAALISKDASSFIGKIEAPNIDYNIFHELFSYTPSIFPHFFYNFLDLTIETIAENKIRVHPSKKHLECNKLSYKINFLNIGENKLLYTGSSCSNNEISNNAFILNLSDGTVKDLPPLKHKRGFHTMTWIERAPAVIGGFCGQNLKSVEIFKYGEWVELSPLNFKRQRLSSICTQKTVWVVGGFDALALNSIEKYEEKSWSVVQVYLPRPAYRIGLCCIDNGFLIIGGRQTDDKSLNQVYYFNMSDLSVKAEKPIDSFMSFRYSSFIVNPGKICMFGFNQEKNANCQIYILTKS